MLDDAAFYAANSLVSDRFVLTTAFNLLLTRPIKAGPAMAEGRWVSGRRRVLVADARLLDATGEDVSRGTGTFMRSHFPLILAARLRQRVGAMSARLAARVEVSGLIRMVEGQGGHAAVLRRGDPEAGAILLLLAERGVPKKLLERLLDPKGDYRWSPIGPHDLTENEELSGYIAASTKVRQCLWVVELDVAEVERFAAAMISTG